MLAGGHQQVIKTQGPPQNPSTYPAILWITIHTCARTHMHTHPHIHLVSLQEANAPENLRETHINSNYIGNKLIHTSQSRQTVTNAHSFSYFLSPDWAAPWGQPPQTALALTINILSGLMMLLLLLHQHVSYGCSELKHTHNNTHLLERWGQPRWVSGEKKEGNVTRHLVTHLVCQFS